MARFVLAHEKKNKFRKDSYGCLFGMSIDFLLLSTLQRRGLIILRMFVRYFFHLSILALIQFLICIKSPQSWLLYTVRRWSCLIETTIDGRCSLKKISFITISGSQSYTKIPMPLTSSRGWSLRQRRRSTSSSSGTCWKALMRINSSQCDSSLMESSVS